MTKSLKLIGQGLQCQVYRLNKKRVLKVPTTHRQKMTTLRGWKYTRTDLQREAIARDTVVMLRKSLEGLKKLITYTDPALMGNPTFLGGSRYGQDHIRPLGSYLRAHSLAENKRAISAYVDTIIQTWRSGFADTIFNFTVNNGIVGRRVVLLDLGELTFSKNRVRAQIRKKSWLKQSSYRSVKDQPLGDHFKREMARRITMGELEKNWRAKITT